MKSLPAVRRQSPNGSLGVSSAALDGGASLCKGRRIISPLYSKGGEGGF
jgi:hypothetical protein